MFIENILLCLTLILMMIFPFLSHPLSMGLNILILTICFASGLSISLSNTWISYALVLVLLGGLLVIFIYVSLLASNELFKTNNYFFLFLSLIFMLFLGCMFAGLHEFKSNSSNFQSLSNFETQSYEWLYHLYSTELWSMTVFLILYLLLTLIVVVSITKNDFSSLRSLK